MKYEYTPNGVCAAKFEFDIAPDKSGDDVINEVKISGGCPGNGAGIAKLVAGMKVDEVIERLENIRCGNRASSCPAQLAIALRSFQS